MIVGEYNVTGEIDGVSGIDFLVEAEEELPELLPLLCDGPEL